MNCKNGFDDLVDKLKIAVFASGKGSNFQAIHRAMIANEINNAEICCVISNNPDAGALQYAKEHSIPAIHLSRLQFDTDEEFNSTIIKILGKHQVNFIVLAGYLKKIDASVIKKFKNRIVNIHPALLPKYGGKGMYGMHVHDAIIASGDKITGATVHLVDEEYDHGQILLQETVPVAESDTAETLAEKVLIVEHKIFPLAIKLFAEGEIEIKDDGVVIDE